MSRTIHPAPSKSPPLADGRRDREQHLHSTVMSGLSRWITVALDSGEHHLDLTGDSLTVHFRLFFRRGKTNFELPISSFHLPTIGSAAVAGVSVITPKPMVTSQSHPLLIAIVVLFLQGRVRPLILIRGHVGYTRKRAVFLL